MANASRVFCDVLLYFLFVFLLSSLLGTFQANSFLSPSPQIKRSTLQTLVQTKPIDEDEARRALEGIIPPSPINLNNVNTDASDDIIDTLRKEALAELKTSITPSNNTTLDIQHLIETALDEEFEKAAGRIKEEAVKLREETEQEMKDLKRDEKMEELLENDRRRLADGEAKVSAMVKKVQLETLNVETAMKNLQTAQASTSASSPLIKIMNFRNLPLSKQAALTACLLFMLRVPFDLASGMDFGGVVGEAGVAVAAGAYFMM